MMAGKFGQKILHAVQQIDLVVGAALLNSGFVHDEPALELIEVNCASQ